MVGMKIYDRDGIAIWHGDAVDVMGQLEKVDHIITDPPYSAHVHANYMSGHTREGGYGEKKEFGFDALTDDTMLVCARQFARLANRWVAVFSDLESCHKWRAALVDVGLEYMRTGIWVKRATTPQFTGDRPAASCETITLCHPRGRKRWNGGGAPAVWEHMIVKGGVGENEPRVHTAQKPIGLMRELVRLFTDPGDVILDPFMGSGTTLRAAKDLGRGAIGIEIDPLMSEIAARRMQQGALFDSIS